MMALTLLLIACTAGAPTESEVSSATTAQTPALEATSPSESAVPPETLEPTNPIEEQESSTMTITINGQTFLAMLYDNETTAALKEKAADAEHERTERQREI